MRQRKIKENREIEAQQRREGKEDDETEEEDKINREIEAQQRREERGIGEYQAEEAEGTVQHKEGGQKEVKKEEEKKEKAVEN